MHEPEVLAEEAAQAARAPHPAMLLQRWGTFQHPWAGIAPPATS